MPAYKDDKTGKWFASFYFTNWQGKNEKKMKRGFTTKREALEWERAFLLQRNGDLSMSFAAFVELYKSDMKSRIREHTWQTKENIIITKLLPYFGKKKMCEILPTDIIKWQNEMMDYRNGSGKAFSQTYIKSMHNQVSAIFNHAVRFYELRSNPAARAGSVGKKEATEMLFWTKEEYLKFAESMMDKPISFHAFEVLYWCGLRLGEMLALTSADFDFEKNTLSVTKSYQRLKGVDIITEPKTPKSKRVIQIPEFLGAEIQDDIKLIYGYRPKDRLFPVQKNYLHREMARGTKEQSIKRIRVHDLRHSHVSLLIEMGFSAVAIADSLGHESIDITYRYAHLFPTRQTEMATRLNAERPKGGF
jgi:integrase